MSLFFKIIWIKTCNRLRTIILLSKFSVIFITKQVFDQVLICYKVIFKATIAFNSLIHFSMVIKIRCCPLTFFDMWMVLCIKQICSIKFSSVQLLSHVRLCDPMNHGTPGLSVHHKLLELTQTDAHRVGDAVQPFHPLSSLSPPTPNSSQYQGLFQWVNSSMRYPKY